MAQSRNAHNGHWGEAVSVESKTAPPEPAEIRAKREEANLTRAEAAELVHSTEWRWRDWETGVHRMAPGLWELFQLKITQRQDGDA